MGTLKGADFISTVGMERKQIEEVLSSAEKMDGIFRKKEHLTELKGKVMASLFYEPSTRTQFSFTTAMRKLGGEILGFSDPKTSSHSKGETLHDTIKAMEPQVDCFVMRHPNEGAAAWAAAVADVPVINAGDGNNQHPTQAMLDLYTIKKEKKKIDGLTVLMLGDLKYGRTVHSLSYALSKFEDVKLQYYSPLQLRFPSFMLNDLRNECKVEELPSLDFSKADVIYATRIQKERIEDPEEYKKASYIIDGEMMKTAKPDAMLMHPLPRVDEIATEVDLDKRAKYFEQEANGIPTRMAILSLILNG
ncbi:MAG TPA: aspartate carbamoyltransferase [Candidatus Norongarragalinales archaeon]|nr:aspartate carbamoyltransferase [Candidatus Norongarragalinales archaeon]